MKSLLRKLFTNQDVTAQDTVGTAVNPQRIRDEKGALQVTLNQDPGAVPLGKISIEGRLDPSLPYLEVAFVNFNDAALNASPFSKVLVDVNILPDMRATTRNSGGYLVAGGTTATVLLME